MIKLIIAYDDNDSDLGGYFEECFNSITTKTESSDNISMSSIRGLDCTEANINDVVSLMQKPYVFVGLSHGNPGELISDEVYVSRNNSSIFSDSLFYSTGCCTAIELGPLLIEQGCVCYIGYVDDSYATYEDFYPTYIECETYALVEFLTSDKNVNTAYREMLSYFDLKINELFDQNEILVAMELQKNKDSFVLLGDPNISRGIFD